MHFPMRHSAFSLALSAPLLLALAACQDPPKKIDDANAVPTYASHIAPMMQTHCTGCHQAGAIGPFELTDHASVAAHAEVSLFAMRNRIMPPYNVDNSGDCQTYREARWVTDAEMDTFERWMNGGKPAGGSTAGLPPLSVELTGSTAQANMMVAYTPRGTAENPVDDYRCFLLDLEVTRSQFITGFEIIPGEPEEVHHMLLASVPADEVAVAEAEDAQTAEPGWPCFGGMGEADSALLGVWAPGKRVELYPEGTGIKVVPGRVAVQMHYNLAVGTRPDLTRVKLRLVDAVQKEAVLAPVDATDIALAPNLGPEDAMVTNAFPLFALGVEAVELHGVFPHMHTAGVQLEYEMFPTLRADAAPTCLTRVNRWNFHWQQLHFYEQPIIATADDSVRITCRYNTNGRTGMTLAGEGTGDEMCLVFTYVTLPNGGALPSF